MSENPEGRVRKLEWAAGGLSILAAAIHGALAPAHLEEWWGYGLFFLGAAAAQVLFGLAMIVPAIRPETWGPDWLRAKRLLYAAGILGNCAIIALYIVTRTTGIPFFGPEAGVVEEVALIDIVSKVAEVGVIVLLAILYDLSKGLAAGARPTGSVDRKA